MPDTPIRNMRIYLYGVQGSGSVFPSRAERILIQEKMEVELLRRVFEDLRARAGANGRIDTRIEDILNGRIDLDTLTQYRRRLQPPEPRSYGGWTTCIRIETADAHDLVFDCGSGFRLCSKDLQRKWGDRPARTLHLFGSHSHLDHTEGFDQASLCFDPRNTLKIYGNRQFLRALDVNLGIFSRAVADDVMGLQTPLFYGLMPATFEACEIRDMAIQPPPPAGDAMTHCYLPLNEPIAIGQTIITPFEVFHPAPCLGYRVQHGGAVFVFCTDHELRHGTDPTRPAQKKSEAAERRLRALSQRADLLYRDGQYLRAEYDGHRGIGTSRALPRLDWGHSCIEDVVEMTRDCRIQRTLIGHHDPNREWADRNALDAELRRICEGQNVCVELARAEVGINL